MFYGKTNKNEILLPELLAGLKQSGGLAFYCTVAKNNIHKSSHFKLYQDYKHN